MRISVTDAKAQLTELVRRAEAGDDIVLTRHGQPVVRFLAIKAGSDRKKRRTIMEALSQTGAARMMGGVPAARSQDFLYDEDGLPK